LSIGAACKAIYFGADLKSVYLYSGSSNFQRLIPLEVSYELGQDLFAQLNGVCAVDQLLRGSWRAWRRFQSAELSCTEQFRAMAFAQLTYRESLRDIETCLLPIRQSCMVWAFARQSNARRWPMPTKDETGTSGGLAALLIRHARKLYCNDSFGIDLNNTVTPWMPRP